MIKSKRVIEKLQQIIEKKSADIKELKKCSIKYQNLIKSKNTETESEEKSSDTKKDFQYEKFMQWLKNVRKYISDEFHTFNFISFYMF